MRIPLYIRVLPAYFVIAALFVFPVLQKQVADARVLAASRSAELALKRTVDRKPKLISGTPNRILIPKLAIDLPIIAGNYDALNITWSVAPNSANFAINTAKNNNLKDKSLIYGHWTPSVFGKTKSLQTNDEVFILTDNNHTFKYLFVEKTVVSPSYTELFKDLKGEPGLVIMTCQGIWAQERRIMFFKLAEVV